jgi:hypothetical protein
MQNTLRYASLALLISLGACASHTTYKTTKPVGRGKTLFLAAPQAQGGGPMTTGKALMPEIALGARHGVTDDLDVQGNFTLLPLGQLVTSISAELAVQQHLWTSESQRFELAVATGVGYRYSSTGGAPFEGIHLAVPVIFGINMGRHQLAISPSVGAQRWYATGAEPVDIPFAGMSLGFNWRLSEHWSLLPEVSSSRSSTALADMGSSQLVHFGIAVIRR